VLNSRGIETTIELLLSAAERDALKKSAEILEAAAAELHL
jgi:malate/lactate dehydrogenase